MEDEVFYRLIEELIDEGSAYVHGQRGRERHRYLEVLADRVKQQISDRRFEAKIAHQREQDRLGAEHYAEWRRSVGV